MSCCMCEPTETAQSLGDDIRAVVKRSRRASEHGLHTKCGPLCVSGLGKWPIDRCSDKDAGKHQRLTPTPCGRTGIDKEREKEKEARGGERQREMDKGKRREKERERKRQREKQGERKRERGASLHLCSSLHRQVRASSSQFRFHLNCCFFPVKRKRVLSCRLRFLREVCCAKLQSSKCIRRPDWMGFP